MNTFDEIIQMHIAYYIQRTKCVTPKNLDFVSFFLVFIVHVSLVFILKVHFSINIYLRMYTLAVIRALFAFMFRHFFRAFFRYQFIVIINMKAFQTFCF